MGETRAAIICSSVGFDFLFGEAQLDKSVVMNIPLK